MRRKVPNVMRSKSKLTNINLTSDKLGDVKKFYGWTERQLEANVRAHTNDMGGQKEQTAAYKTIYGKKD
jgi:hypothetical protein